MSDTTPQPRLCLNCATELHGSFCHRCGQKDQHKRVPLKHLLHDVVHDLWHFDTKVLGSLWLLVRRPGFLAGEYLEGRRVRHVPPFRLYVVLSFITFAVLAMLGSHHDGKSAGSHGKKGASVIQFTDTPQDAKQGKHTEEATAEREATTEATVLKSIAAQSPEGAKVLEEAKAKRKDAEEDSWGKILERRGRKATENPEALKKAFLGWLSKVMFLLMPVFAALLFLLHARKRNTYFVDHMVVSLHFHTVTFLALLTMVGFTYLPEMGCWGGLIGIVIFFAPMVWLVVALQHLHRRGWFRSILKATLVGGLYGFVVSARILQLDGLNRGCTVWIA